MNDKQFKLMWGVIIGVIAVLAFPPINWGGTGYHSGTFEELMFFFDVVNFERLNWPIWIIEFLVLAVVSVGLWITFSDKRQRKPPLPPDDGPRWWKM